MGKLSFDEWYAANEEEINIELAETGADRELDFDPEAEFQIRYQKYLGKRELKHHQRVAILGMSDMISPIIMTAAGGLGKSGYAGSGREALIAHRQHHSDPVITLNGQQFRRISWADDRITQDFVEEVELILQKKSKLSRAKRDLIMHLFNLSFKPVSNG